MSDQQEYVILRTKKVIPSDMLSFDIASTGPDAIELEEATLSSTERLDLQRDPRTRAVARSMPMQLIAPVDEEGKPIAMDEAPALEPAADEVAWGVDAVGAGGDTPAETGQGVVVAVLDTGIDPSHDAFAGMTLDQRNFTDGGPEDEHGHGTHCAGTIFGRDVSGHRIGVARGVEKALIGKVLGPGGGSTATLANAINWALAEGAHVISMSLGIDFPGFVDFLVGEGFEIEPATSIALEQYRANVNLFSALAQMVNAHATFGQGTLIVAASGNESRRDDYEIAVAPPAAGTGVVAVGALGESASGLRVASFSNTEVDVSAPGVGVVSARVGGGLTSMNGTSMATPHVAGVAALWAERLMNNGRIEPGVVLANVIAGSTTAPLAAGFTESAVGAGIVQAPA